MSIKKNIIETVYQSDKEKASIPESKYLIRRLCKINVVIFLLLIFFVALSAYFGIKLYNPNQLSDSSEARSLIAKVSKLIVLPSNEQPTIATVTDLGALKDQLFFAQAHIGDKVLIYSVAKKAILYNPSENRIIEVAPLIDDSQNKTTTNSPEKGTTSSGTSTKNKL